MFRTVCDQNTGGNMLELDHLAVAAETLDAGRAHVEEELGVAMQPGGQHAHFGTHNVLLGLDDGLYLEVIAIDPTAPAPGYPRWFDLDRFAGEPRISNWICRTKSLPDLAEKYPSAGQPVALQRGDLQWSMAVPENGVLPFDGGFPALIEWAGDIHPAQRLNASGCRLQRLTVMHPHVDALRDALSADLCDDRLAFEVGPAGFHAAVSTPHGHRSLS